MMLSGVEERGFMEPNHLVFLAPIFPHEMSTARSAAGSFSYMAALSNVVEVDGVALPSG